MKTLLIVALIYMVSSTALDCGPGAVVNNEGVCVKPSYIEGCYQYASSIRCFECSSNYVLASDGKCQYKPQANYCCKIRNVTTGICEKCHNGLFLENGKCF